MATRNYYYSRSSSAKTVRKNAFWTEVNGVKYLVSYETIVASITDNRLHRHWNDYSTTTMNHINKFCDLFDVEGAGKKAWEAMPVEKIDYEAERAIREMVVPVKTNYVGGYYW